MTISRTGAIVAAMKLTLESAAGINLVRGYSALGIRIGEQLVTTSCIVSADRLVTDWAPQRFADFRIEHTAEILALAPDVVVLGTGAVQQFPSPQVRALFAQRGIGLESMDLGAACRTFNVLVQEERRVAAALFVS
jgi:uncharacterized protein